MELIVDFLLSRELFLWLIQAQIFPNLLILGPLVFYRVEHKIGWFWSKILLRLVRNNLLPNHLLLKLAYRA